MEPGDHIAAGAVLALLLVGQRHGKTLTSVRVVIDAEGNATNQLELTLSFLRSPYRLTVERVTDDSLKYPGGLT
jgi:hypothetical protein